MSDNGRGIDLAGLVRKPHSHGFVLKTLERYRDEDKNETILEVYVCECGAGKVVPQYATLIDSEEV